MNELYLKKIDVTIEESLKKKNPNFNLENLINYIVSKINSNSSNEESTQSLENILIVNILLKIFL